MTYSTTPTSSLPTELLSVIYAVSKASKRQAEELYSMINMHTQPSVAKDQSVLVKGSLNNRFNNTSIAANSNARMDMFSGNTTLTDPSTFNNSNVNFTMKVVDWQANNTFCAPTTHKAPVFSSQARMAGFTTTQDNIVNRKISKTITLTSNGKTFETKRKSNILSFWNN